MTGMHGRPERSEIRMKYSDDSKMAVPPPLPTRRLPVSMPLMAMMPVATLDHMPRTA
jgi:hypothetical protein